MFKLRKDVEELHKQQEKIMSAIDNLSTAVTALQTEVIAVQTLVTTLQEEVAGAPVNNDVAIQAAADSITTVIATLANLVAPVVPAPVVNPAV